MRSWARFALAQLRDGEFDEEHTNHIEELAKEIDNSYSNQQENQQQQGEQTISIEREIVPSILQNKDSRSLPTLYSKPKTKCTCSSCTGGLVYSCNLEKICGCMREKFVELEKDEEVEKFLEECENVSFSKNIIATICKTFYSVTDANGIAGGGQMFVFSTNHLRKLFAPHIQFLIQEKNNKNEVNGVDVKVVNEETPKLDSSIDELRDWKFHKLLDIGAGNFFLTSLWIFFFLKKNKTLLSLSFLSFFLFFLNYR